MNVTACKLQIWRYCHTPNDFYLSFESITHGVLNGVRIRDPVAAQKGNMFYCCDYLFINIFRDTEEIVPNRKCTKMASLQSANKLYFKTNRVMRVYSLYQDYALVDRIWTAGFSKFDGTNLKE